MGGEATRDTPAAYGAARAGRAAEWAALGEWLESAPPLHEVDLVVMQERLGFVGRARSFLAALEAQLVGEIGRREGDAAAEETLWRGQKRSRRDARKAVKTAAQLEWAPRVAERLAEGAITPEAAGLILDAGGEADVDQRALLAAAEAEPEDLFRRTLKDHVNERTSEQELERRRERQRRRRRASIGEQPDGMYHLFAQLDPLTGARVQTALLAKADALFRSEDPKDRPTVPQRFADALAELIRGGDGAGKGTASAGRGGADLIVLADYDQVHDAITGARLADGTRLTMPEALAVACDANLLPGIFNKHTGNAVLGRSQRKVSKRHRKQLVARDGGCIGCAAHHNICEVHHLKHWAHGGETTLDNTCLLCWRCHHVRVHQNGEQVTRHPGSRLTLAPPTTTPADPAPRHDNSLCRPAGSEKPTNTRGDQNPSRPQNPSRLPLPEPHRNRTRNRPAADRNRPDPRPDEPPDPRQRLPLETPTPAAAEQAASHTPRRHHRRAAPV